VTARRRPLAFILSTVVLVGWTGLTVVASLSPNALSSRDAVPSALRDAVTTVAPQRWEFFTASPRGKQLIALTTDGRESALDLPQSKLSNFAGISRAQRAQGPELAALQQQVTGWVTCADRSDSSGCLNDARTKSALHLANDARRKTLCGPMILAQAKPTPFEFRRFDLPDLRVIRAVRVEISCN
jgi:antimicrobial peptide system SdpA family protein